MSPVNLTKANTSLRIARMIVVLVFIAGMVVAAMYLARHAFVTNDQKTLLDACTPKCTKLAKSQSSDLENQVAVYGFAAFVAAALALIGSGFLGRELLH